MSMMPRLPQLDPIGVFKSPVLIIRRSSFGDVDEAFHCTQLPVSFEFPWLITVVVVLLSLLFGFLASIGPLAVLLKMSPVQILRA